MHRLHQIECSSAQGSVPHGNSGPEFISPVRELCVWVRTAGYIKELGVWVRTTSYIQELGVWVRLRTAGYIKELCVWVRTARYIKFH